MQQRPVNLASVHSWYYGRGPRGHAVGWLVARWSGTDAFTDRHRIWLIGGALVGHSVFALASGIINGRLILSLVLGIVVIGVTVLLVIRLDLRLRRAL